MDWRMGNEATTRTVLDSSFKSRRALETCRLRIYTNSKKKINEKFIECVPKRLNNVTKNKGLLT